MIQFCYAKKIVVFGFLAKTIDSYYLAHLINFIITSGKKYRQGRVIKCPPNYFPKET